MLNGGGDYSLFLTAGGKLMPCCYFAREDFDITTLDIKNEFNNNKHRITCLRICGSIK